MKFKFIGNAGVIFSGSKGSKILCDPWIIDGVFEGSWYNYPPLKTKISDLQDIDALRLPGADCLSQGVAAKTTAAVYVAENRPGFAVLVYS